MNNYTIRPLTPEDCASLAENANNINIWNMVRDRMPHPYTEADARTFIECVLNDDLSPIWTIDMDGRAVGMVGAYRCQDVERISAEVGYWLGEPYWGQGIVTAATKEMCEHIFATTDLIHLFATVAHNNPASMRVLEKAGFTKVGVRHRAAVKNGQVIDIHYFELVK